MNTFAELNVMSFLSQRMSVSDIYLRQFNCDFGGRYCSFFMSLNENFGRALKNDDV